VSLAFTALGVPAELAACLDRLGIAEPYPIQSATLPDALGGKDVFAQSPTGSGKTLAFAIPLVARIGDASARRPRGLVLAPTRELAAQIAEAFHPLAGAKHRHVASFYGGTGYKPQLDALRRGVDIAVGCPGRLVDLLERGALDLSDVEVVVVDEADRMADMGFLPAVRQLLDAIRGSHQTMLFSATVNKDVERLVRDYQHQPVRHLLGSPDDSVGSRSHEFWRAPREDRSNLTARLVHSHASSIVFCRTKHGADRLARQLTQAGVSAVAIHGDRSQAQRDRALEQFRSGRAQVLVGTDVASRGLHVEGVECVVHFDPPEDADTYIHRSGRTGRAGSSGRVVSLVSPDQERGARNLVQHLGLDARIAQPPELAEPTFRPRPTPAREPAHAQNPRRSPDRARTGDAPSARQGERSGARRRTNRSRTAGQSPTARGARGRVRRAS
jgi:superfamily II DNA/RNA helicase